MPAHSFRHFTGRKSGKRIRRKPRRAHRKPGSHQNKYAHLAPKKEFVYDLADKRVRFLPVTGNPGDIVKGGTVVLWHDRRYRLARDTIIPPAGGPVLGRFELF